MLVMKFGGASVKNAAAIKNVCQIILQQRQTARPMVVVVSAMDKTTNHLEKLAFLARDQKEAETWTQFELIRDFHLQVVQTLFGDSDPSPREQVLAFFKEVEQVCRGILLLGEFPFRTYDRIVSFGELLSTTILAAWLEKEGLPVKWWDIRKMIKTDATHASANVIWSLTGDLIKEKLVPGLEQHPVAVVQGFIASTVEGKTTTLGREGSDFTASILAHCLKAEKLLVWKDVIGILNADPRFESETEKHPHLSYEEAVEMTFYGAKVIHPKTIRPLFSNLIPLYVRCFLDVNETGTVIGPAANHASGGLISSKMVKRNQALMKIQSRDFSFMEEHQINRVLTIALQAGVGINLIQTSAISLSLCLNNRQEALQEFESLLIDDFHLEVRKGLELRTIMYPGPENWAEAQYAVLVQYAEDRLFMVVPGEGA